MNAEQITFRNGNDGLSGMRIEEFQGLRGFSQAFFVRNGGTTHFVPRTALFLRKKPPFRKEKRHSLSVFHSPSTAATKVFPASCFRISAEGVTQQRSVRLADAFHHEHPVRILAGKHQHDPDLFANRGEGGKSLIVTDQMPNCIFTHPGCIRLNSFHLSTFGFPFASSSSL